MKILRVYSFLPPLPGGMEKHILELTRAQRELDCDVTVMFNRGDMTGSSDLQILRKVDLKKVRLQVFRDFVFFLVGTFFLAKKSVKADIVHIHGDWSAFLFGKILRRICNASVMTASVHGALKRGRWAHIYRLALSGYDLIYCTGVREATYLKEQGIKVVKHQNSGIGSYFFNETNLVNVTKKFDVISVANFLPIKNLMLVVEIAKMMPAHSFLFVGDGPERRACEEKARRLNLKNVYFAGALAVKDVFEKMHASRAFLSTSKSEGTPTALLEAMACGLPVITGSSNDYSHLIVQGQNGFVLEGENPVDYANVLISILTNDKRLQQASEKNRKLGAEQAWPVVAEKITKWMKNAHENASSQ